MRLVAIVLFSLILPSIASAQSAQEFWRQEFSNRSHGPIVKQHGPRFRVGTMVGGSWLHANLGASRPRGAPGLWCGYAMRLEMISLGKGDPGPKFNLARNWCQVGSPAPIGAVGSIFVSRGHVSKVVAGNCPPGRVATISGNASGRRVSHMCEPISRAICSRWP